MILQMCYLQTPKMQIQPFAILILSHAFPPFHLYHKLFLLRMKCVLRILLSEALIDIWFVIGCVIIKEIGRKERFVCIFICGIFGIIGELIRDYGIKNSLHISKPLFFFDLFSIQVIYFRLIILQKTADQWRLSAVNMPGSNCKKIDEQMEKFVLLACSRRKCENCSFFVLGNLLMEGQSLAIGIFTFIKKCSISNKQIKLSTSGLVSCKSSHLTAKNF